MYETCPWTARRILFVSALERVNRALTELSDVEADIGRAIERGDIADLRDRLLAAEESLARELRNRSERSWALAMVTADEGMRPC
jgi:hypothetical protein